MYFLGFINSEMGEYVVSSLLVVIWKLGEWDYGSNDMGVSLRILGNFIVVFWIVVNNSIFIVCRYLLI